jgi:hypothetical protein
MIPQRIFDSQLVQKTVAGTLDDFRARIEVLVNAMSESEQPRPAFLVLDAIDELFHVLAALANRLEHLDHFLVRSPVERAPESRNSRGDRGVKIRAAAAHQANGGSTAVLLVVGVQDEKKIERLRDFGLPAILLGRYAEHHLEKVGTVID